MECTDIWRDARDLAKEWAASGKFVFKNSELPHVASSLPAPQGAARRTEIEDKSSSQSTAAAKKKAEKQAAHQQRMLEQQAAKRARIAAAAAQPATATAATAFAPGGQGAGAPVNKGKGKGDGKGNEMRRMCSTAAKTPRTCKFSNVNACTSQGCTFKHVCWVCGGKHSWIDNHA